MRQPRVECLRNEIRGGDDGAEAALWDYIGLQWPYAVFDDFQKQIITCGATGAVVEIAIKGCTKPGKGFSVGMLVCIWFDVYPDSKVIITSSDIDHATTVMFGQVKRLWLEMKYPSR